MPIGDRLDKNIALVFGERVFFFTVVGSNENVIKYKKTWRVVDLDAYRPRDYGFNTSFFKLF